MLFLTCNQFQFPFSGPLLVVSSYLLAWTLILTGLLGLRYAWQGGSGLEEGAEQAGAESGDQQAAIWITASVGPALEQLDERLLPGEFALKGLHLYFSVVSPLFSLISISSLPPSLPTGRMWLMNKVSKGVRTRFQLVFTLSFMLNPG